MPYIIGYYLNTYLYFQFFGGFRGCSGVNYLANRLSSFVFLFLGYYKRFQAKMASNHKQPQVLG